MVTPTALNHQLADDLGLDFCAIPTEAAAALFEGQYLPVGSQPIAQAYAGHQYGGFTHTFQGRRSIDNLLPRQGITLSSRDDSHAAR